MSDLPDPQEMCEHLDQEERRAESQPVDNKDVETLSEPTSYQNVQISILSDSVKNIQTNGKVAPEEINESQSQFKKPNDEEEPVIGEPIREYTKQSKFSRVITAIIAILLILCIAFAGGFVLGNTSDVRLE